MRDNHIPITKAPLPFTPTSLYSGTDTVDGEAVPVKVEGDPAFSIQPTTEAEFERLGYELFRHNIIPPSNDTFRTLMIDEIFAIFGEAEGDEKADMLDAYWQAEDVHRDQMAEWHEQERQRLFDEAAGAPKRSPNPLPTYMMGIRDRNRARMFAEEIRNRSRKVRDLTVEMQTYEPKQRAGLARLVILGWTGVSTPFERVDGIVPETTYAALRDEIGAAAMREIETFCASQGAITAGERGNSESLLETGQSQEPSSAPSGALASSDGGSMSGERETPSTSNSTPAPETVSAETTAMSSNSTSSSTGEAGITGDTQAEPSSTLPSG